MFLLKELQCNVRIYAGYLRLLHSFLCSEARTASVLDKELFTSGLALGISVLGIRKTCWARLKTELRPFNKGLSEESSAVDSDQLITALRHSRTGAFARLGHRAGLFLLPRHMPSDVERLTQRNIFQNVTPVSCHLFSE